MTNKVNRKFRALFALAVITALCCCVLVIWWAYLLRSGAQFTAKAKDMENRIAVLKRGFSLQPQKLIAAEKAAQSMIAAEQSRIKDAVFKSRWPQTNEITPMAFKERLFDYQDTLRKKAAGTHTALPESLGFKEYALDVPEARQVDVLMKELFMADDVLGILLKNRVYAVVRVEFPHQYTQLKKKTGVNMTTPFSVVSMDVSLETDLAQINKILQDLAARDIIYNVKKITMKRDSKDSDHVNADIKLECICL
ncbi:MAG: Amuc_1100 family pilus-like protein [Candidatus Omnitrophica bacterium]|nr:Amuc_1100 family pilus-like protein [Candidatus Omnitrophota bacterium]MCG2703834.1 Amuc_1100 family pilus-like protein [Candidatus Omnitrophota bacterium]